MLIRPRLNDAYNLPFTQEEVDFAIPFLDEDLPLSVDPFLLWKSPSQQDNALNTLVTNSFNHLGRLFLQGKEKVAIDMLIKASECYEVGLGDSRKRRGRPIGVNTAKSIFALYKDIPQINKAGFVHFEEIQLFVDNISKDRISDITCSFIKSHLIDYTIFQSKKLGIPRVKIKDVTVYDYKTNVFLKEDVDLPCNPDDGQPVILVPRRWLRYTPWINYDDYYAKYFIGKAALDNIKVSTRIELLDYNRHNYDIVQAYTGIKELKRQDCKNDPLFEPIPILSANKKFLTIKKLPTGKTGNADRAYEDNICQLMASLLYPQLDFAAVQSRTESGVLIRDLVFYNNNSHSFLKDIYDRFNCRQIVFELKNVKTIEREHINQLNRYLNDQFGNFGIIVTRNPIPNNIFQNTIDLWSGQRKCIIILSDIELALMCQLYKSKQRISLDVIKKKFVEFERACPG